MSAFVRWEPRDLWIGVYWTREPLGGRFRWRVYLCIVPCVPIIFEWWRKIKETS